MVDLYLLCRRYVPDDVILPYDRRELMEVAEKARIPTFNKYNYMTEEELKAHCKKVGFEDCLDHPDIQFAIENKEKERSDAIVSIMCRETTPLDVNNMILDFYSQLYLRKKWDRIMHETNTKVLYDINEENTFSSITIGRVVWQYRLPEFAQYSIFGNKVFVEPFTVRTIIIGESAQESTSRTLVYMCPATVRKEFVVSFLRPYTCYRNVVQIDHGDGDDDKYYIRLCPGFI